jgi:hypothetical protein
MKANITNRTSSIRRFAAGGRYLTLAGGESERGIEISKEEADALNATNEFYVREVEDKAPQIEKFAPRPADTAGMTAKPATT